MTDQEKIDTLRSALEWLQHTLRGRAGAHYCYLCENGYQCSEQELALELINAANKALEKTR